MNKSNFKSFFIYFCVFFAFFVDFAYSAKKRPIIDNLWYDIDKSDKELLKKISVLLESEKYDLALKQAESIHKNYKAKKNEENPFFVKKSGLKDALKNLILWKKYSNYYVVKSGSRDSVSFNDLSRFIEDNKFYPNLKKLRRKAEDIAVDEKIPYRLSEQYFLSNSALDLESKLYLIDVKSEFLLRLSASEEKKNELVQEIENMIIDVWVNENFDEVEEADFLEKYSDYLTQENHNDRINRLLWDSKYEDAERIFAFVDEDHRKLYSAIIEIKALPKYINKFILSVPRKLRRDNNLTYARILWHKSRNEIDDIVDLMQRVKEMKYPQRWWSLRRLYARELLKSKDYRDSYRLISNHGLKPGQKHHWEGEWMSGWIALRFLKREEQAYQHFLELYNNVKQPVTLARASYWLGMASVADDDTQKAIYWYKNASQYPLYFYGQLAIHKLRKIDPLNQTQEVVLPKDPDIRVGDARRVAKRIGPKVAFLLALMGDKLNATKIFNYEIYNSDEDGEIAVLMRIVNDLKDNEMNARVARTASKKNVFFIRDKFQMAKEVDEDGEYAPLIHAIIKQESGFTPSAVSAAGAIGFMQIMPDTARKVAEDLGVRYSRWKLGNSVKYNVKLGSHYIKQMVERFDGSEMLAIASYNAGPHNADRWIREFYDPRDQQDLDKVIDWIELITYSETRNYVQRIMENLIVYKYLMKVDGKDEKDGKLIK